MRGNARLLGLVACLGVACGGDTPAGTGTTGGSTAVEGSSSSPSPTSVGPGTGTTTGGPVTEETFGETLEVTGGSTSVDLTSDGTSDATSDATSEGTTAAEPFCGDGLIDPGEACDDGPGNGPGQACNAMCQVSACGDGDVGPGEDCDDGANNGDMSSCKVDCTNNVCGDGAVGPGEGCDDGNQNDADECGNYSSFPATAPTRRLTSKLHGRNRWVFPRPARGPPTASPRPCPPGLEKSWRRALA
jgi:cysteine-rich repeat protein